MAFLSSFDICASGMDARRVWMDIAVENITHTNTTGTEAGGPYRRKDVLFESFGAGSFREATRSMAMGNGLASRYVGVRVSGIIEGDREMKQVYNPRYPDADAEGYVNMPNVDLLKETVDSMSAIRSCEASVIALNAMKLMAQKALNIGK